MGYTGPNSTLEGKESTYLFDKVRKRDKKREIGRVIRGNIHRQV